MFSTEAWYCFRLHDFKGHTHFQNIYILHIMCKNFSFADFSLPISHFIPISEEKGSSKLAMRLLGQESAAQQTFAGRQFAWNITHE